MRAPCTLNHEQWPPDYVSVYAWRQQQLLAIRSDPALAKGAKEYYRTRPAEFINHWCSTFDPRNAGSETPARLPMVMFRRQELLVDFLMACLKSEEGGLVEKSRDMGATWVCADFSVWLWLFWEGAAVGWGSRKEELVDKIGDPKSIFEKIRQTLFSLPPEFLPRGFDRRLHAAYMKVINPENGASITGEAGDNIGRGGRTLIYFKDESAHYERPEKIEAALSENTRVQIDISSVKGLGNVFHRRREAGIEWHPEADIPKGKTRVFIMDWRDHPAKTQEWYDTKRQRAIEEGLLHVFAQEVDRDYAASVEGVIIPSEWVKSAIDAHVKLGLADGGMWGAGLDVADEGMDRNALALRRGPVLMAASEWGERDTGVTTRKTVSQCSGRGPLEVQYDCIGVGAGVKAEVNRLADENLMPPGLRFVPWNAGAAVLAPKARVIEGDKDSPRNEDFYTNLKAQGWWQLRRRFEKTHRAVTEGIKYDPDELISLPSDLPLLRSIQRELSQPTATLGHRLRLLVEKAPEGAKSPNLGDAIVMAYWPVPSTSQPTAVFATYGSRRPA